MNDQAIHSAGTCEGTARGGSGIRKPHIETGTAGRRKRERSRSADADIGGAVDKIIVAGHQRDISGSGTDGTIGAEGRDISIAATPGSRPHKCPDQNVSAIRGDVARHIYTVVSAITGDPDAPDIQAVPFLCLGTGADPEMTSIGGDIPGAHIVKPRRTVIHFVDDDHIEPGRSSGQDTTHTGRIIDPTVSLHGEQTGAIGLFDGFTRGEADAPVITKSLKKQVAGGCAGDVAI